MTQLQCLLQCTALGIAVSKWKDFLRGKNALGHKKQQISYFRSTFLGDTVSEGKSTQSIFRAAALVLAD
jgi:hypothetical protein